MSTRHSHFLHSSVDPLLGNSKKALGISIPPKAFKNYYIMKCLIHSLNGFCRWHTLQVPHALLPR